MVRSWKVQIQCRGAATAKWTATTTHRPAATAYEVSARHKCDACTDLANLITNRTTHVRFPHRPVLLFAFHPNFLHHCRHLVRLLVRTLDIWRLLDPWRLHCHWRPKEEQARDHVKAGVTSGKVNPPGGGLSLQSLRAQTRLYGLAMCLACNVISRNQAGADRALALTTDKAVTANNAVECPSGVLHALAPKRAAGAVLKQTRHDVLVHGRHDQK
jgi:hypothetical protein